MASTFTPNINLEEPALGDYVNSWQTPVNSNWSAIDQKFGGISTAAVTGGTVTLTVAQAAYAIFNFNGALASAQSVILPSGVTGFWLVANSTSGAFSLTVKATNVDAGYAIPQGSYLFVFSNGTSVLATNTFASLVAQLGYTPANKAGDTFTGGVTFSSTATFNGTTTVPTVATGDVSTNAANTALVAAKIAAIAPVAPQVADYTAGSGMYNTPANALCLEIEMIGGGSGGGGAGISGGPGGASTAGGTTTFGASLLTAHGGAAAPGSGSATLPAPATASGGDINVPGGIGQAPSWVTISQQPTSGGTGASTPYGSGGVGAFNNLVAGVGAATAATGVGAGGGGGGWNGTGAGGFNPGYGGNAGAFLKTVITSPAGSYAYAVGAGGGGGTAGTYGTAGAAGAAGQIRIIARFQ